jgi:hypothetical protein
MFGEFFLLLAWISSPLMVMFLTERIATLCKIDPWDSLWRPATGITWLWITGILIFICTPELSQHLTWQRTFFILIFIAPLTFAWWLRAKNKFFISHALVWVHILAILGISQILESLSWL